MELGICTFGEVISGGPAGTVVTPEQRLANLLEEIELADRLGLDVFGVGEHHRQDFAVSAPTVVLGAAAARTERIRLSSAVTVLSSDDPVRVFEQFATVDLLSHGRAEIMAGRGSFTESFPSSGRASTTTTRCSPRSSSCSWRCVPASASRGRAVSGRRSTTAASTRARSRIRCRCGSPSAGRRSR